MDVEEAVAEVIIYINNVVFLYMLDIINSMIVVINSTIVGFIVGIILYKLLHSTVGMTYHGPNSNYIKKYIYQDGDKYYQFNSQICPCPI